MCELCYPSFRDSINLILFAKDSVIARYQALSVRIRNIQHAFNSIIHNLYTFVPNLEHHMIFGKRPDKGK